MPIRKRIANPLKTFSKATYPAWSDHQPRTPLVIQDERLQLFTVFDCSVHHDEPARMRTHVS